MSKLNDWHMKLETNTHCILCKDSLEMQGTRAEEWALAPK